MKTEKISRGDFFKKSAIITAGVSAAGLGIGVFSPNKADANSRGTTSWPWPYTTLDPDKARVLGHDNFWAGYACSAGTFDALIKCLEEAVGDPYVDFPTKMLIFGHGGAVGWGTLCGVLTGGAAAISLVCEKADSDKLINELIGWYSQALFPSDLANDYAINHLYTHTNFDMDLTQSISGSPLCHVSVSKWCTTADIGVGDNQRKERCARIVGDTAAKVVELLNAHFAGTFAAEYVAPAAIASCLSCHGSDGMAGDVAAKMDCNSCHPEQPHMASSINAADAPTMFEVKQNFPNPLSDETTIEFSLFVASKIRLDVYNLNGQFVKTLIDNQNYPMGGHSVKWNGTDSYGKKAVPGMYIYRLSVGKKIISKTMMKL